MKSIPKTCVLWGGIYKFKKSYKLEYVKEYKHNLAKYKLLSQASDLLLKNYVKEITWYVNIMTKKHVRNRVIQVKNITSLHLYPTPVKLQTYRQATIIT